MFVGADPLGRFFGPAYVIGGTLPVSRSGIAWGGAVVFERDDLGDGEAAFLRDLRRTVSDDGTLAEHLDVSAADRTRAVVAGGSPRESLERFVRFFQITRRHAPLAAAVNVCLSAGPSVIVSPVRPSVIVSPVSFLAYALARRTFVWGGRRYRWRSMFDVNVEPA